LPIHEDALAHRVQIEINPCPHNWSDADLDQAIAQLATTIQRSGDPFLDEVIRNLGITPCKKRPEQLTYAE
jgi:hypothetical protein